MTVIFSLSEIEEGVDGDGDGEGERVRRRGFDLFFFSIFLLVVVVASWELVNLIILFCILYSTLTL